MCLKLSYFEKSFLQLVTTQFYDNGLRGKTLEFPWTKLFISLKAGILHTKPHISLTLRLNIWLENNYFERGKIILGKTYYTIHQELKPDDYLWTKELSFSHKFKFSNPYILATRWCKPLIFQTTIIFLKRFQSLRLDI